MTSFSASRVSSSTSAGGTDAIAVPPGGDGVSVTTTSGAQVSGERLLVATGRYADTDERRFSGTPDTSPAGKIRGVATDVRITEMDQAVTASRAAPTPRRSALRLQR